MADITITQKITIELDGKSPFEYVVMKQGDKGSRVLAVSLLQNKQPYEIPTGCTARIKYYKPDGNPVMNDCTLSGNEILVTYTEQMLAAARRRKRRNRSVKKRKGIEVSNLLRKSWKRYIKQKDDKR